jgi:hypothetical protein
MTEKPPDVFINTFKPVKAGATYPCPCCKFKTLSQRGGFEICEVCFWEDDGQDDHDADIVRGGPNSDLSLTKGRENFKKYGASDPKDLPHVRKALPEEM